MATGSMVWNARRVRQRGAGSFDGINGYADTAVGYTSGGRKADQGYSGGELWRSRHL